MTQLGSLGYFNPIDVTVRQRFHADDDVEREIRRQGSAAPWLTSDARRYPNVNPINRATAKATVAAMGITDPDLVAVVTTAFSTTFTADCGATDEECWAYANVTDAAIDEQDRRRGITPTPVTRISRRDAPPL
jgi:hypothetical protein